MNRRTLRRSLAVAACFVTLSAAAALAQCPQEPTPGVGEIPTCGDQGSSLDRTPTLFNVPLHVFVRQPFVSVVTWAVAKPRHDVGTRQAWTGRKSGVVRSGH